MTSPGRPTKAPSQRSAVAPGTPVACAAIIPCAGVGSRAGTSGPKQYVALHGLPVLCWTLLALDACKSVHSLWCVVAPEDPQIDAVVHRIASQLAKPLTVVREGGATRAASVQAGLAAALRAGVAPTAWALVHDAARCLIHPYDVERLHASLEDHPVGGLLATPVPDTLKRATPGGEVMATLQRDGLWAAQTPQMFRLQALHDALQAARHSGLEVTDEASAMEAQGFAPLLVASQFDNFKLTYPTDFERAERVLRARADADFPRGFARSVLQTPETPA